MMESLSTLRLEHRHHALPQLANHTPLLVECARLLIDGVDERRSDRRHVQAVVAVCSDAHGVFAKLVSDLRSTGARALSLVGSAGARRYAHAARALRAAGKAVGGV